MVKATNLAEKRFEFIYSFKRTQVSGRVHRAIISKLHTRHAILTILNSFSPSFVATLIMYDS